MDDETAAEIPDAEWPDLSAEQTLALNQQRAVEAENQQERLNGKIRHIDAQIELMGERVTQIEGGLSEANEVPRELAERLDGIDRQISSARARFQTFSTQLAATSESVGGNNETTSAELAQLSGQIEDALTRISELGQLVDADRARSQSRLDTHSSDNKAFATKVEVVERSMQELNSKFEKVSKTVHESTSTASAEMTDAVSALSEQAEEHSAIQAQNAAAIQILHQRAQRLEKSHENYATKVVEHVNLAHRRLTQSSHEISAIHAKIAEGETSSGEERSQLEAQLAGHTEELRSLLATIDQVTTSVDARLTQQESLLQEQTTAADSLSAFEAKRIEEAEANAAALAALELRAAGQEERLAAAVESIDAASATAQTTDAALGTANEQLAGFTTGLDIANREITAVSGRVDVHDNALAWVTERLEQAELATAESVTALEAATAEAGAAVDEKTAELTNKLDETSKRLDILDVPREPDTELVTRIESVSEQVLEQTGRVDAQNQLLGSQRQQLDAQSQQLEMQSQQLQTQTEQMDALNEWTSTADDRMVAIEQRAGELGELSEAARQRLDQLADIETKVDTRNEEDTTVPAAQVTELHSDISAVAPRIDTHGQQIDALNDQVVEVGSRLAEIAAAIGVTKTQIEAVDQWSIGVDNRIEELQRSDQESGQALATNADQLQAMGEQLQAHATNAVEVEAKAVAAREDVEQLSRRLDGASNDLGAQASAIDDRIDATQQSLNNMAAELTAIKKQVEDGAGLSQQVDALAAATTELQATQKHSPNAGATDGQGAAAGQSVRELEASVQHWIQTVEQSNSNSTSELRELMIRRIDAAEDRIERRIAGVNTGGAGTERIDRLERGLSDADERARDALAFSENLRLLQTDLVQALQSELTAQAQRITQLELILSQR